jgi:hypothetical protein
MHILKRLLFLLAPILIAGCVSTVESGPAKPDIKLTGTVVIAPFANATDDDNAGRAFADLMATELARHGLVVVSLPPKPTDDLGAVPAYTKEELIQAAKKNNASGVVRGTAIEFRYKTDLDGDPAAGVYVEILDPTNLAAMWHGSSSRTGLVYASLAGTAQTATRDVVARMPIR